MDNEGPHAPSGRDDAADGRAAGSGVGPAQGGSPVHEAGEADRVARFLQNNPDWLSQQTGLYECLSPPKRVHGDALADHMAAMIDAARERSRTVLDAGRAGLGLAERVRSAVLALIRSDDPAEWIAVDLPRLLGIDAARLCVETGPGPGTPFGAGRLPAGLVNRLLGARDVLMRPGGDGSDAMLLHGEAAGLALHEALLRLRIDERPPLVVTLAARAPGVLDGTGAEAALGFLAQALAARLERS